MQTEEFLRRFDHRPSPYALYTLTGFDWQSVPSEQQVLFEGTQNQANLVLNGAAEDELLRYFQFALHYRCEDRAFWIFEALLARDDPPLETINHCMERYPPLVYSLLKKFLVGEAGMERLPDPFNDEVVTILRNVARCANELGIAALVALEKLSSHVAELSFTDYTDLLWLSSMSVRSKELVQEILMVLHDSRLNVRNRGPSDEYGHNQALAVTFDRAEEASDTCPCDDTGRPRRQRVAPLHAKLVPPKRREAEENAGAEDEVNNVMAHIRVDAVTPIRIHSHVRLQVASKPEHSTLQAPIVDAVILRASRGEMYLRPFHPLPPEYDIVTWNMYDAGSVATSRAMLDAVLKLLTESYQACRFYDIITGGGTEAEEGNEAEDTVTNRPSDNDLGTLNQSQKDAVNASQPGKMSLIWGPPGKILSLVYMFLCSRVYTGTGKTTVVVQILLRLLRQIDLEDPDARILMTASTHNGAYSYATFSTRF